MPLGLFAENAGPRDYRFRGDCPTVFTRSGSTTELTCEHETRITWGIAYAGGATETDPSATGIRVLIHHELDSGGTESWAIYLWTPWGYFDYSGTGQPDDWRLEIDQAELTADADCAWALSFDELRFYVDDVLEETIGAQSESGSAYDRRENDLRWWLTPSSVLVGKPACDADLYSLGVAFDLPDFPPIFGAQYDSGGGWTSWDVWFDEAYVQPTPSPCGCVKGLPGMGPDPEPQDSWDVEPEAFLVDELTSDTTNEECPCPEGYTGGWTADVTRTHREYHRQQSRGSLTATDARILSTRREASAYCHDDVGLGGASASDGPTDTLEAITYAEWYRLVEWLDAFSDPCCDNWAGSCTSGGLSIPHHPTCEACFDPGEVCYYFAEATISHPSAVDCPSESWPLSYDVSKGRRHARIVSDGADLALEVSQNSITLAWGGTPCGFLSDVACLRFDKTGDLWLWTIEGGDVKERTTTDEGANFSMATTIFTGPGYSQVAGIVGDGTQRFVYARNSSGEIEGVILDAGDNVVEGPFTAYAGPVDDSDIAVDESVTQGGVHRLILQVFESGSLVELYSTSGKSFA